MNFVDEVMGLMSSSETSKDDTSIEALLERHAEHKVLTFINSLSAIRRQDISRDFVVNIMISLLYNMSFGKTL